MMPSLLVIDDERNTREALKKLLSSDFDVTTASGVDEARDIVRQQHFQVILTDLRLGGNTSGLDIVQLVVPKHIPCIIMTAFGDIDTAVTAMKNGAFDFITKPLNIPKLKIAIRQATAQKTDSSLQEVMPIAVGKKIIYGEHSCFRQTLEKAVKIADNHANVLIFGETGTGKEILAQMIHQSSRRKDQPFIAVHCASLSSTLLESELFGHEKGAFTGATARHMGRFEAAHMGTLFLDEIGEIDAGTQVKLLRFLETKTFERVGGSTSVQIDVRIISATHKNLLQMVHDGTFREDLYYRLNVIELKVPSLHDRIEDIPLLVRHYIDLFCGENALQIHLKINPKAIEKLTHYPWPGNIRELRNTCESIVALLPKDQDEITINDLGEKFL